jgi:hypothetical protein
MKDLLQSVFTGKDNATQDVVKWMAMAAFVIGMSLQVYQVVIKGSLFDLQNYSIGVGTLLVTLGAALKIKETTEPTPEPKA